MAPGEDTTLTSALIADPADSLDGNTDSLTCLIDDLQSECDDETLLDNNEKPGESKIVPEGLLQTNHTHGLSDLEVALRRRRYGWNELREEKSNLFKKLLVFFWGPIEVVMEVSRLKFP